MKRPDYKKILEDKIAYYGATKAAFHFAAEDYALEWIKYKQLFGESEDLLEKYIAHIEKCEGTNFISRIHSRSDDIHFTDREIEILKKLAE